MLLAMATLLAHALAVHRDEDGRFGQPYEVAHEAYHLGRNLVREGSLAWNPAAVEQDQRGGLGAYPSPLWVAVAALGERLYLPVNLFTQFLGVLAALAAVGYSARFSVDRIAGVIPPLLLVTSGAFAAAGPSGTEMATVALLLTVAFVSYEHGRRVQFAASLALLVAARPEGLLIAASIAGMCALEWRRPRRAERLVPGGWHLAPAGLMALGLWMVRDGHGQSLYGGFLRSIFRTDGERTRAGLAYLWDFLVTGVTPFLVVFPLLALALRKLTPVGGRALLLSAFWVLLVVLEGGGPQPFTLALVPILPLLAIAIQQGVIVALDSHLRILEKVAWTALLGCALVSALASKFPGNRDSLLVRWHVAWLGNAAAPPPFTIQPLRGRLALGAELRRTAELRDLGSFLREEVDPRFSILSPWTGAIGYLSRMVVLDLFGVATVVDGSAPAPPWSTRRRVDLVAALEQGADFVLPGFLFRDRPAGREGREDMRGIDRELLDLDLDPDDPERQARLFAALARYEMVTLPVVGERRRRFADPRPVYLLRRRDLGISPTLDIGLRGGLLFVEVGRTADTSEDALPGHPQLARLEVKLIDASGKPWYLSPLGELTDDAAIYARTELRLESDPGRPIRLFSCRLGAAPDGEVLVEARARLYNPLVVKRHPFAPVCDEVVLELE